MNLIFQALDGVFSYVDAKDIPGANDYKLQSVPEPVFANVRSEYAGQPVGVIIAESRELAVQAAKLVQIAYKNEQAVLTDMEKAMEISENVVTVSDPVAYGDVNTEMSLADCVISGRFRMGSQYHFHMETQVCIAKPTDDGFDIEVPTQHVDLTATVLAKVLNEDINRLKILISATL